MSTKPELIEALVALGDTAAVTTLRKRSVPFLQERLAARQAAAAQTATEPRPASAVRVGDVVTVAPGAVPSRVVAVGAELRRLRLDLEGPAPVAIMEPSHEVFVGGQAQSGAGASAVVLPLGGPKAQQVAEQALDGLLPATSMAPAADRRAGPGRRPGARRRPAEPQPVRVDVGPPRPPPDRRRLPLRRPGRTDPGAEGQGRVGEGAGRLGHRRDGRRPGPQGRGAAGAGVMALLDLLDYLGPAREVEPAPWRSTACNARRHNHCGAARRSRAAAVPVLVERLCVCRCHEQ